MGNASKKASQCNNKSEIIANCISCHSSFIVYRGQERKTVRHRAPLELFMLHSINVINPGPINSKLIQ